MSFLFAMLAAGTTGASVLVLILSAFYRRSENARVRAQGEAGPVAAGVFFVLSLILWGVWAALRFS